MVVFLSAYLEWLLPFVKLDDGSFKNGAGLKMHLAPGRVALTSQMANGFSYNFLRAGQISILQLRNCYLPSWVWPCGAASGKASWSLAGVIVLLWSQFLTLEGAR